jgi:hypothetical protein
MKYSLSVRPFVLFRPAESNVSGFLVKRQPPFPSRTLDAVIGTVQQLLASHIKPASTHQSSLSFWMVYEESIQRKSSPNAFVISIVPQKVLHSAAGGISL